jgi:hypothetical protein
MLQKEWLRQNRTLVTAIAATLVLGLFVFAGKLEISRCVVALVFIWGLASHSKDVQDHKEEIAAALERAAKAGLEFRAGQVGACAEDLEGAGQVTAGIVHEVRAEHQQQAGG